jgi:hypothetical protein
VWIKGREKNLVSSAGVRWRPSGKFAKVSASQVTSCPNAAVTECPTAGIVIPILANQALWIRRYMASVVDSAGVGRLYAESGQFTVQVSPYGEVNSPIGYPALSEIAINSAGATQGVLISKTGVDFALFDDWIEFDDVNLNTTLALIGPLGVKLQTFYEIANITAGALNCTVGEAATWEIWEAALR